MTRKCKVGFVSKNILRNLQLHFKTVVMFRRNFRHFLVGFALFFANSTTVWVALVAKPLVLPAQWFHLPKKSAKST